MKKVLIITYYWPPSGGPGVQRVLKFVKYLPEMGWQPVILTVMKGEYPQLDETLQDEIPPGLKVYKSKSLEPFHLYKSFTGKDINEKIPTYILSQSENESIKNRIAKWVRANVFIPDAKIGWIPYAVKSGKKIIEQENIDVIFSSSPPHSLQNIAYRLKKATGLKWVADFRDPWSGAFWQEDSPQTRLASKIEKYIEKKILTFADHVVSVSPAIIRKFNQEYKNNYSVIYNGYDARDFENLKRKKSDKFRIRYFGHLGKNQICKNLFAGLSKLCQQEKSKIEINFYGSVHTSVQSEIEANGLNKYINLNPYLNHSLVVQEMVNSELLLLMIPNVKDNAGIVTGKIFEYLATGNYILAIGPKDGDAAVILHYTSAGTMFDFQEPIENTLFKVYNNWQNDQLEPQYKTKAILKYDRKNLTKQLANILDQQ